MVSGEQPTTRNLSRYFVETRHVAWVLFVATFIFGAFAYAKMPKRKDPLVQVRAAVAVCAWPGASAEQVEERITRRLEEKIAESANIEKIESTSRTGVSIVVITLRETLPTNDIKKTFDDIALRLQSIHDLPRSALPIELQKDFGDTATLMLTVASPPPSAVEIALRARALREKLAGPRNGRSALVFGHSITGSATAFRRVVDALAAFCIAREKVRDARVIEGPGFFAIDAEVNGAWSEHLRTFLADEQSTRMHPDVWSPVVIDDPAQAESALAGAAGERYDARQLEDFTQTIARRLRALPTVAKVTRAGTIGERVYLDYSQERLTGTGLTLESVQRAIASRNIERTGGHVETGTRTIAIAPSGELATEEELGDTLVGATTTGAPVRLRDLVDVSRDYEPPLYTAYLSRRDASGALVRTKAISVAVQMMPHAHVADFAQGVDAALADLARTLPEDLVLARTSDQPKQVEEKISLFMTTLYEAIAILIVIGLVGFREWRSALVLAISIPLTLAMTFVFMYVLGIDIQQMSIAALILALGLLVDDPGVAGDAIVQELDNGTPRDFAAWIGPTKLARAILFATITNIVAYLPFLLISGDVGNFIYSLPIVLGCSLVASRIVSMTFIPLLGRALLRPQKKKPGPTALLRSYRALVAWCIRRRYRVLAGSLGIFVVAGVFGTQLRDSFFPSDLSHLFYVDVWLPEDAPLGATSDVARDVDRIVREVAEEERARAKRKDDIVRSITTFVGGGAPRFWYSLSPQMHQPSYAQLVIEVGDERDAPKLIAPLQKRLSTQIAGARIDVRQLENGKPVPQPVEIRITGDDPATLHAIAERTKDVFRAIPIADRVRDDWGTASIRLSLDVDQARAALAGVSSHDVRLATMAGFDGVPLDVLRDGEKRIPIFARLRHTERGNVEAATRLGVAHVPLGAIARVSYGFLPEKIKRRNQQRTISVSCFPTDEKLPSEVMSQARGKLSALRATLPPGYALEVGGTEENVIKVQKESLVVAAVSTIAIFLALVLQLKHALKPLIVFAAIPYGLAGGIIAIVAMGSPFGFTAILGLISLIGVIVSHIIVLFDYIEEAHERGDDLETALLDAGTARLRPVLVTVGATVLGLVPLALHGGPLWEPLCYAQIGGLTLATVITPVLVPILYAVFVLDLKWLAWHVKPAPAPVGVAPANALRLVVDNVRRIPVGSTDPMMAAPARRNAS